MGAASFCEVCGTLPPFPAPHPTHSINRTGLPMVPG